MNIRPLHDRVVVKRIEEERTTAGGIVIPDNAGVEKPTQGDVIAVGLGKNLDNGDVRPVSVKVGDRVVFAKYSGTDIKLNGQDLVIMREDDIMGVIEK